MNTATTSDHLEVRCLDDQIGKPQAEVEEAIISNAMFRLVGKAFLTPRPNAKKLTAGSVVETDKGALLLWLHAYPLQGQDIELVFTEDKGCANNEVSVILDHTRTTQEFVIGSVVFAGKEARVSMFGLPAIQSSLLIREPSQAS